MSTTPEVTARTGVRFVGPRGSVATTAVVGAYAVAHGVAPTTALVTAVPVRRVLAHLAASLAACLVAGLAALLLGAPPAAAHDELLSSDPSASGVVAALPSRAVLTFTGPVAEVHEITVTGPDGSVVNGDPTSVGPEVRQNLWAGPDGSYTVTYDVLSADGHEIAGEITFQVGEATRTGQVGQAGDGSAPAEDEGASSSSASGPWSDGTLRGALVPMTVVLLSGAAALVLRHRRRSASTAMTDGRRT